MSAIVVLGMHRSGTSCLAGMLAAGGLASAGEAVRNWDNARGHHEMLDAVRLNEAVLAANGGHWLQAPGGGELTWSEAQAAERDRLLVERVDGRPALLKDPRTLLVLPFWRASRVPWRALGIVRHPLAVARSLESWRGVPLEDGVRLWTAHNRALEADRARFGYPLIDFERPKQAVVAAVLAAVAGDDAVDAEALAAAYEEQLVHHDGGEAPAVAGLAQAEALYARLAGRSERGTIQRGFPRAELAVFATALERGDLGAARAAARAALAAAADPAAVLVPVVTALGKARAFAEARTLVAETAARLDDGLADLLLGKLGLASGDAAAAARHLEAACAVPAPLFQARHLLPQALRAAGRAAEARAALCAVARDALYPHGPLATLAEWSWQDGARRAALAEMAEAVAAAPPHRRGRLRTRRAEWLAAEGDPAAARAELARAVAEDPDYPRSRELLARLGS